MFYLDGSPHGRRERAPGPDGLGGGAPPRTERSLTHREAQCRGGGRGRALLISVRVCRVGLTPSRCMYKQGSRQRSFVMLLVERDRASRFAGTFV